MIRTLNLKVDLVVNEEIENNVKNLCGFSRLSKAVEGTTRKEIISNLHKLNDIVYKIYNYVSGLYHMELSTTYIDEKDIRNIPFTDITKKIYSMVSVFAKSKYEEIGGINGSLRSAIYDNAVRYISTNIKNNFKDIVNGNVSFPQYKKGAPIPVYCNERITRITKYNNKFYLVCWGFVWEIILGRDKSGNSVTLNKIVDELKRVPDAKNKKERNITFGDSWFIIDDKEILFKMSVNEPTTQIELNKNIVVGVDLGLAKPVVICAFDKSKKNAHGIKGDVVRINDHEIIETLDGSYPNNNPFVAKKIHNRFSSLNIPFSPIEKDRLLCKHEHSQRVHNDNYLGICGKGYKRKMSSSLSFGDKERKIGNQYAHILSKQIVKFAIENQASAIHLEKLKFSKKCKVDDPLMFSLWGYFDLFTKIEYKASKYGIKVVYINPKYTSEICSDCEDINNINKEGTPEYNRIESLKKGENNRRISQSIYICPCGNNRNADYNASINIARCNNIIKK